MSSFRPLPYLLLSLGAFAQGLDQREPELWRKAQALDQGALEALALKANGDVEVHLLGRLALLIGYKPMVRSGGSALLSRMKEGFDPLAAPATASEDLVLVETLEASVPEARQTMTRLLARIEELPPESGSPLLERAIRLGSKEAKGAYGLRLIQGRGAKADPEAGFQMVVASNSALAAVKAAELLEARDPAKARKAFLASRDAEDPRLALRAGRGLERLAEALPEPGLLPKAKEAYATAAAAKVGPAAAALARFEAEGRGASSADYPKVKSWAEKAVAWGAPEGHYWLGWLAAMGHETPRDLPAALAHFRAGAEAGDPDCTYRLALATRDGEGLPADAAQAAALFTRAADLGHPASAFALAQRLMAEGRLPEARTRLLAAAQGGHLTAQVRLAALLTEGVGGPADLGEARVWLGKAALRHDGEALFRLAMLDLDEVRTKAQAEAVLDRLREAATEGHAESLALLRLWRP